jgi:hypothetical protein
MARIGRVWRRRQRKRRRKKHFCVPPAFAWNI